MRSARAWLLPTLLLTLAAAAPARADRLILIPIADLAGYSVEYMERVDGTDEGIGTLTAPVGYFAEVLVRYNRSVRGSNNLEVGGMVQLLPQGWGVPSFAVGIWDITHDGPPGRRAFLALTRDFYADEWVPRPFQKIQLTAGVGTGRLGGVFGGARAEISEQLSLIAEWDTRRVNSGIWFTPVRGLTLKGELHGSDPYVGAQFRIGM